MIKEIQSVMEGDSVTLNIDFTEIDDMVDDIVWTIGDEKSCIAKHNKKKQTISIYDDVLDGRFRDRLKLDNQTGSLTIMNISTLHAGVYKVDLSGRQLTSKTFNVSVYARLPVPVISRNSSQCSSSSSSSSSCSLLCSAVNVGHVTLSWYKGNSLLSSISVSDLSISLSLPLEVEHQDKNTYSCVINNPIRNQTQHINVTQLCQPCPALDSHSPSQDDSLPILLISAGSLFVLALITISCIYSKRKRADQEVQTCIEEITYAETTFFKRKSRRLKIGEETHVDYASVVI
ncbi:SLAM family member 5-like [Puntigrus tetrazona]|uniref:SLAM family member 5-like n=1 Tax=Puntigrus tetrazona TaxID=1606681 RepID=UPI001C8912C6|nr:SLAM family member 5-like [Puntigrus tetrazona]